MTPRNARVPAAVPGRGCLGLGLGLSVMCTGMPLVTSVFSLKIIFSILELCSVREEAGPAHRQPLGLPRGHPAGARKRQTRRHMGGAISSEQAQQMVYRCQKTVETPFLCTSY